ncbi:MAG: DUF493 family protein YbeD [Arsenophonus sp. ET-DL9-MAG3]
MKTKLHELLEFPCSFTYKIIGISKPELINQIIKVVQRNLPGDYVPSIKQSSKGNFCSISISIIATNIKQIKKLYEELAKLELVRMVL